MIREDFKKEQKDSNLTSRELAGIKSLGERQFYTTSIYKMTATIKSLNFSSFFTLIFSSILLVFIIIIAIVKYETLLTGVGILGTIFTVVAFIWCIIWYTVLKKRYYEKIERYRQRIKEISEREIKKKMSLYEKEKK